MLFDLHDLANYVCNRNVSFSHSSQDFLVKLNDHRLIFCRNRMILHHRPKRIICPQNVNPERLQSFGVRSYDKRCWMLRRCRQYFLESVHFCLWSPNCRRIAEAQSFTPRTVHTAMSFVSNRWRVDVQLISIGLFRNFSEFQRIVDINHTWTWI